MSKEELEESSTVGSPFVPEMQDKSISQNFKLLTLEAYDGILDPLEHIQEKCLLRMPNPIKTRLKERDQRCYCHFHRDYDHDTEECHNLKNQIKDLICWGHLGRFVRKLREPSLHPKGPMEK
ncbi:hypothetical protein GW17_00030719 [Ensete ventricosum]|nr:hypothetical protein GW17_00030719 [Ensete ventricosum]